ncbi:MAG TPA: MBL fold metallo-hydrolase [Longimicrobiales bacterium]|nr:MBL fold metallo-hydrolase [Longimicrobiales bacterium]
MRVTVLGSGSGGNSTLVEAAGSRVLVDAGFSGRDLERRLREVAVDPAELDAIVITHDHGDHTRGMGVLARRFGLRIYLTERTRAACAALLTGSEDIEPYRSSEPFRVGALEVRPFLTVHDAADPVAVTVRDTETGARLGVATDLGRPTAAVRAELAGCHMLVLEANHDDALLWSGPYPWSVKQRIASSHGHLSNRAAAELAQELFHPGLRTVVLAHLSEHCNDGAMAVDAVGSALGRCRFTGRLVVAPQDRPLDPFDVRPSEPDQLALTL